MPKFLEVTDVTAAKSFIGLPELNVRDFGAVGNGTADDSTAISDTITALPATGGTVFFPPGTYIVPNNTGLAFTKSNVRFKGDQAVIKSSNTAGTYVSYQLSVSSCSNIVVEGLTFDGGLDEGITADCNALVATNVTNFVVSKCSFVNCTGAGIVAAGIKYAWLSENYFSNIDYSGINLDAAPDDGVNEYVWIQNNHLEDCSANEIQGWAAIRVRALGTHRYINILNNTVHNVGWIGITADKISHSRIVGNTVIKDDRPANFPTPGSAKGECISFGGQDCIIAENYCRNDSKSYAPCIVMYAGPDDDGSPPSVKNVQVANNRCTNGLAGIFFLWSQDGVYENLLITGNQCYSNTWGIKSGLNTSVTAGTQTSVVVSNNALTDNTVDYVLLNNDGGVTGPVTVSANALDGQLDSGPNVQTFTANGTWTKPSGAVSVHVRCVGPGGGGGAGARGPSGTALAGGRGGGSGGISEMTFLASDLPGTVSVTTAVGGIGAAGQTSDGTAGAAGTTPGQQSSFGSYLRATRGAGGGGGGLGAAGGFGSAGAGIISGQAGGASSATGAAGSAPTSDAGPGAGGGGGGITAAAAANNGGAGGFPVSSSALVGGTAGSGAAGGNGASSDVKAAGSGGGGGAANAAGAGYDGGDGGNYGAGGGGGGASLNGNTSGAGGDGGDGIVIVTTYF